jgi:hypothetical protein
MSARGGVQKPSAPAAPKAASPRVINIDARLKRLMNGGPSVERGSARDELDFDLEGDDEEDDEVENTLGLSVLAPVSSGSTVGGLAEQKNMAIYYLQKELKLTEATLMNVILKYSWVMYLKVETNLKPTVEVLRSFGFKDGHIRTMVSIVPSVLAINHNWTLPEKLISIQKMFHLSRGQLVRLCCEQPLLLTSSIERNMAVSEFLSDQQAGIGLSPDQIRSLLQVSPRIAMTGLGVLKVCWSVLTVTYALPKRQARQLISKHPTLLSRRLLTRGLDKLRFFREELQMPVPEGDALRLIARCPAILYLETDVFLRPNVAVLRRCLHLEDSDLSKLVAVFPQLLGCNPASLERQCRGALWLLTGLEEYLEPVAIDGDWLDENEDEDEDEDEEEEEGVTVIVAVGDDEYE